MLHSTAGTFMLHSTAGTNLNSFGTHYYCKLMTCICGQRFATMHLKVVSFTFQFVVCMVMQSAN